MYKRIETAILEAMEERRLDFDAVISMGQTIKIDTRISRDPRRANNGGEYYFWEKIWRNEAGEVLMRRFASCDFWQPEEEPELLGLTWSETVALVRDLATEHGIPIVEEN